MAGPAMELLTGFVTAPSTTLTNLTMATGNTLVIRSANLDTEVYLLTAWTDNQTAGQLDIRSPRLHDFVFGIRMVAPSTGPIPLFTTPFNQKLVPQDVLTVQLSGSGTAGDIETASMLIYYTSLPGVDARLADWDFVKQHGTNIMGVLNTLALGTAGGYSGQATIVATQTTFKANTDYALVGYTCDTECACIRWQGVDTGNLGVGGPGNTTLRHVTNEWFIWLSEQSGLPCIPIFNSANQGSILIDGAQDENGADTNVTSFFVELH